MKFGAPPSACLADNAFGDINTRKGYVRSIIDAVEVDDHVIRIIGSKDVLQDAIADK